MRFLLRFLLSITNRLTFAQDYPTRPVRITAVTESHTIRSSSTITIDHFELLERIKGRTQLDSTGWFRWTVHSSLCYDATISPGECHSVAQALSSANRCVRFRTPS